jgi:hypothetical protein
MADVPDKLCVLVDALTRYLEVVLFWVALRFV